MLHIVIERTAGVVKTKVEVLGGAPAVTSYALWMVHDEQSDDFRRVREVKTAENEEGVLYEVGDADLDGKLLEWVWTTTRAAGSNAVRGTVRITVQQGGRDLAGFPMLKEFDFDDAGPVTLALTRRLQVAS